MSSIAQLISEIAHSYGQPNNHSLREKIRNVIVHTRAEIIRRSYENHNYVDKLLTQRFKVTLTSVVDGDFELPEELQDIPIDKIKRTNQKVPRPIRLTNNLPFDRVSTAGYRNNRELPYIKETTARFRGSVPGLCGAIAYDYFNEYNSSKTYYIIRIKDKKKKKVYQVYNTQYKLVDSYSGSVAKKKDVIHTINNEYKVNVTDLTIGYENGDLVYFGKYQNDAHLYYFYYSLDEGKFVKYYRL